MTQTNGSATLKFSLVHRGTGETTSFELGKGDSISIGRAKTCNLVVEGGLVSTQHVELLVAEHGTGLALFARDLSRNGTGVRSPSAAVKDVKRLPLKEDRRLQHCIELVVPFRLKNEQEAEAGDDSRTRFEVQYAGAHMAINIDDEEVQEEPIKEPPKKKVAKPVTELKTIDTSDLPDVWDPETKTGRWRYEERLGEGGLGIVFRGTDMSATLPGEVAIKVLKRNTRAPRRDARHAFAMHRESQWSLWRLHNEYDSRHRPTQASIFVRYLEDHTGFSEIAPPDFDAKRKIYEAPSFDWEKDGPPLPARPYVVMELVKGEALQSAIDRENRKTKEGREDLPILKPADKCQVLMQCAKALDYLSVFGLIHRDFRGCNMHIVRNANNGFAIKVLDLGVMISAEDGQSENTNSAVQAFKRRGETDEKKKRYDWLPWEVRLAADGIGPPINFAPPSHSFDIFSFGVLALHLLFGKVAAREVLDRIADLKEKPWEEDTKDLKLDPRMIQKMLGVAANRPAPSEILQEYANKGLTLNNLNSKTEQAAPATTAKPQTRGRSRSRSKERKQQERRERAKKLLAASKVAASEPTAPAHTEIPAAPVPPAEAPPAALPAASMLPAQPPPVPLTQQQLQMASAEELLRIAQQQREQRAQAQMLQAQALQPQLNVLNPLLPPQLGLLGHPGLGTAAQILMAQQAQAAQMQMQQMQLNAYAQAHAGLAQAQAAAQAQLQAQVQPQLPLQASGTAPPAQQQTGLGPAVTPPEPGMAQVDAVLGLMRPQSQGREGLPSAVPPPLPKVHSPLPGTGTVPTGVAPPVPKSSDPPKREAPNADWKRGEEFLGDRVGPQAPGVSIVAKASSGVSVSKSARPAPPPQGHSNGSMGNAWESAAMQPPGHGVQGNAALGGQDNDGSLTPEAIRNLSALLASTKSTVRAPSGQPPAPPGPSPNGLIGKAAATNGGGMHSGEPLPKGSAPSHMSVPKGMANPMGLPAGPLPKGFTNPKAAAGAWRPNTSS